MKYKSRSGVYEVKVDETLDKDLDGEIDFEAKTIRLRPGMGGRRELDTIIHETLHAEDPDASEQVVTAWANRLSSLLWRMGYRRRK